MKYKILLVDDEPDIIEFISYNLKKENFDVHSAGNGRDAIKMALKVNPDLILLDVMMPEMDGIETCQELRKYDSLGHTIIAFLTARSEDYSQIAGFEAGADDYITKPIRPKVLISKINALLKRVENQSAFQNNDNHTDDEVKSIIIDRDRYAIIKDGEEIYVPRKEFELLSLLCSKPHKVFMRDEIFSHVWGDDVIVGERTIDVHIRKLREKIGENHIVTIKGVGYKYED